MRNIHDPNEFHKFKSTSGGSNNGGGSGRKGPSGAGWVVIIIVGYFFLHFLFSGASWEAIETLLALGIIAYLFFNWVFK